MMRLMWGTEAGEGTRVSGAAPPRRAACRLPPRRSRPASRRRRGARRDRGPARRGRAVRLARGHRHRCCSRWQWMPAATFPTTLQPRSSTLIDRAEALGEPGMLAAGLALQARLALRDGDVVAAPGGCEPGRGRPGRRVRSAGPRQRPHLRRQRLLTTSACGSSATSCTTVPRRCSRSATTSCCTRSSRSTVGSTGSGGPRPCSRWTSTSRPSSCFGTAPRTC